MFYRKISEQIYGPHLDSKMASLLGTRHGGYRPHSGSARGAADKVGRLHLIQAKQLAEPRASGASAARL